jgi:hypothetical protein
VLESRRIHGSGPGQMLGGPFQVDGIPKRGSDQVQAAGSMGLALEGSDPDFAERLKKTARASELGASPLMRPADTRRRRAGAKSHKPS